MVIVIIIKLNPSIENFASRFLKNEYNNLVNLEFQEFKDSFTHQTVSF